MGLTAHAVESGLEAVSRFIDYPDEFGLILMDMEMPEMGGLTAATLIRQQEAKSGGHIPIIALTAHAMAEAGRRCIDAGMDDYLSKPFDLEDLQKSLNKWLNSASSS
jgi:CheY-like chemotaxis protein